MSSQTCGLNINFHWSLITDHTARVLMLPWWIWCLYVCWFHIAISFFLQLVIMFIPPGAGSVRKSPQLALKFTPALSALNYTWREGRFSIYLFRAAVKKQPRERETRWVGACGGRGIFKEDFNWAFVLLTLPVLLPFFPPKGCLILTP